ncbi:MAG: extracellular solute-binding protein [Bacteroidales bacterium]|nr:extracellular solute-binding protein [Lachnoclostridium sp.]MCM1383255.1 extracellular solute-binding protein [Lachnoclostridium sp.]MCM1465743.1 extracellular solute-binding protein [Bacteroidales bacterium]
MKKAVALFMAAAMVFTFAACSKDAETQESSVSNSGETSSGGELQNVSLRIWGAEEDQKMLQDMIDSFKENYGNKANFNIQLGVESEATARDTVLTDIQAAADVYAFASDQLPTLVDAGALMSIDSLDDALRAYAGKGVADIKSANSSGSVEAATYKDILYAFPMTADNGYFLFYNSNIVSAEEAESWDTLLEAAGRGGKKVGMTLASGWYNASFFYGAGFITEKREDGGTDMDWNQTSKTGYTGVQVVQAMLDIAGNSAFMAVADNDLSNQIASGNLCAVVSGVWDAEVAQKVFGDGYAATKLPTFTVNGEQVQQGSVIGCKLIGVNAYSQNAGWAALLAEWITNEENQVIRFKERALGPSNINAASSDEVKANIAIAALAEQSSYGVIQLVGDNYWDTTKTFGENIAQGTFKRDSEEEIQKALDDLLTGATAPLAQ